MAASGHILNPSGVGEDSKAHDGWAPPVDNESRPTPSPKRRRRTRNVAVTVVAVAALVIVIVSLFTIQIATPYSYLLTSSYGSPGAATLSPPMGSEVTGNFSAADGELVVFSISDSGDLVIFSTYSGNASFSFTASSPPYTFASESLLSETVNVSGHFTAPLL